jgi:hypothetical protein
MGWSAIKEEEEYNPVGRKQLLEDLHVVGMRRNSRQLTRRRKECSAGEVYCDNIPAHSL